MDFKKDPRIRLDSDLDETTFESILNTSAPGVWNDYHTIRHHNRIEPVEPRLGGFFRFEVPLDKRDESWSLIEKYTAIGGLGISASMPTIANHKRFHENCYDPEVGSDKKIPIFVHSRDAYDLQDRHRIWNNLVILSFTVNNDQGYGGNYFTSESIDKCKKKYPVRFQSCTEEDIAQILQDSSLESINSDFEVAYSAFSKFQIQRRLRGHFYIDVHEKHKEKVFKFIKTQTKFGELGSHSSISTEKRNQEFAAKCGKDPKNFRIFIHTYDAEDDIDKKRVVTALNEMGYNVSIRDYKLAEIIDAKRPRICFQELRTTVDT